MHQLGVNPAVDVGDCISFGLGEQGHAVALALKNTLYCSLPNPLLVKKWEKPYENSSRGIPGMPFIPSEESCLDLGWLKPRLC